MAELPASDGCSGGPGSSGGGDGRAQGKVGGEKLHPDKEDKIYQYLVALYTLSDCLTRMDLQADRIQRQQDLIQVQSSYSAVSEIVHYQCGHSHCQCLVLIVVHGFVV